MRAAHPICNAIVNYSIYMQHDQKSLNNIGVIINNGKHCDRITDGHVHLVRLVF
jgi:hypothetical protein